MKQPYSQPPHPGDQTRLARPAVLGQFAFAGLALVALVWGLGGAVAARAEAPLWPALALFAATLLVAGVGLAGSYPHRSIGLCNGVTLLRAALVAPLAVPLLRPDALEGDAGLATGLLAVALVALALDGVDGWLARRSGLSSGFGARFDMETDALLALILSILVLQSGKAGVWVLLLGSMRYAYVVASWRLAFLRLPLPPSFRRKAVCVVQIAALIALLSPWVVPPLAGWIAAAATAGLIWSFAVDIRWQAQRR